MLTRSNNQFGNYVLYVNCKSRFGVPELVVGSCEQPFLYILYVTNVQKIKSIDPCFFYGLRKPNEGIIKSKKFEKFGITRTIKKSPRIIHQKKILVDIKNALIEKQKHNLKYH